MSRHEEGHFDHVSQWFPKLTSEWTFDTRFIHLTTAQGEALVKGRENGRMIGTMWRMSDDPIEKEKYRHMHPFDLLNEEQKAAIKEIEEGLNQALNEFTNGAFVRLDTRSPKDAILNSALVRELLTKELKSRPHNDVYSNECATDDAIAYWRATSKAGCVHTGAEAIELLCGSNRVHEDLQLGFLAHPDKSAMLVVREWKDIHPELEFRVFVVENTITGITQYHKGLYVNSVHKYKDDIMRLICEKFEKVKDKIVAPNQTFTIDFVLEVDNNANESLCPFIDATVVEINDPPPTAGTSLFEWENENDRELIQKGPLSIRVLEAPISWQQVQQNSTIHPPLLKLIDAFRGRCIEPEVDTNANIIAEEKSKNCVIS